MSKKMPPFNNMRFSLKSHRFCSKRLKYSEGVLKDAPFTKMLRPCGLAYGVYCDHEIDARQTLFRHDAHRMMQGPGISRKSLITCIPLNVSLIDELWRVEEPASAAADDIRVDARM